MQRLFLPSLMMLVLTGSAGAAGRYLEVTYKPSDKPGELQLGVTYTLWLPEGVAKLRGVIVHQHGCGVGACKGGETAAYDLHWQALAKKWDCALLGPSYHQGEKDNCRLWCDPANGSDKAFRNALAEFATRSKHPELAEVPWCLWGHSGGGVWASLMQVLHPRRCVAVWLRSGTFFMRMGKDDLLTTKIPDDVYLVPTVCNPGVKEKGDKRFDGIWTASVAMFKAYRGKNALITFAPDPRTNHECGDSRYLAIPFFDACLAQRLPAKGTKDHPLKPMGPKQVWLAELNGDKADPAMSYPGKRDEAVWLPNEAVAKAWVEYVKTGAVSDTTPPPAPYNVKASGKAGAVEITWDADADFESGLRGFILLRDGKPLAELLPKPGKRAVRPLFQPLSYHDTPQKPLSEMRYVDKEPKPGGKAVYAVVAVNGVELKSEPATAK